MKFYLASIFMVIFCFTHAMPALSNDEPISPIQAPKLIDLGMVELGKKLFYERRLSPSGHLACNSCHNISMGGVDNLQFSVGYKWQQGTINTPTVLNSSLNFTQFWNGRAATLQEQAGMPLENPIGMASSHSITINVLKTIPGYVTEFKQVFGDSEITGHSRNSRI